MQTKKIILLGAAALGVYYLYGKSKINYNFVGLKFNPFRISFDIFNPSGSPVKFNSIVADILYNGSRIGIISDFTPGVIPGNSHAKVDFQVQADGLGIASVLGDVSKGIQNISISIIGTMKINNILLPINNIYKIK
jgi:LEA14-like dessication related protein